MSTAFMLSLLLGLGLAAAIAAFVMTGRRRSVEVRELVKKLSREVEQHRESEERYRLLIENAPDAIVTLDREGRFTSLNPHAEAVTGWSRDQWLNQPLTPLVHPDDLAKAKQVFKTALAGHKPPTTEIRVLHRSGEPVPMEFTITPHIHDARVCGVLAIGRDISARRKAEQAQAGLEVQLRRAQRMEAIGRLAGGIAHDFNNFLTVILARAQLIHMELPGGHPALESIDEINKAGQRATEVIRQILAFSRNQQQERNVIKLEPVIKEAVKLLRTTLPSHIEIVTQYEPNCASVLADISQIHQVLLNLGTNAAHAMRTAGGHLEISLNSMYVDAEMTARNPDLQVGLYVRLSVSDTGHGMNAATLERIFDPFFTTKAPGEGTGLGLAVVHGIIKSHEGAISVYSEPGCGSVFNLYFPAAVGEETQAEVPATPIPFGSGQHVLFVDDEASLSSVARRLLERLGYQVTICADAFAALELLRASGESFDCIISDQTMPRMNGVEFARECQQHWPDLPFILTSGYHASATAETLNKQGIHEFVLKPYSPRTLGEALNRVLSTPPDPKETA